MNSQIESTKRSPAEILEKLENAYKWAGITKGRTIKYQKIFREFTEENLRSRKHIFAYNEISNINEVYALWKARYPISNS